MSGLIPAGELTAMRDVWDAALDQTCKISRITRAADGIGGTTDTYAVDATTSKVLIDPVDTHEGELLGARFGTGQIEYLAKFSGYDNPQPKENDRLVNVSDGHTYEIITVVDVAPSYALIDIFGLRRLT